VISRPRSQDSRTLEFILLRSRSGLEIWVARSHSQRDAADFTYS